MKHTPETIGKFIKDTRKSQRLTQQALALTSGTGLRFIIDLEKGKPSCHFAKSLQVLQTLGIDIKLTAPHNNISENA